MQHALLVLHGYALALHGYALVLHGYALVLHGYALALHAYVDRYLVLTSISRTLPVSRVRDQRRVHTTGAASPGGQYCMHVASLPVISCRLVQPTPTRSPTRHHTELLHCSPPSA